MPEHEPVHVTSLEEIGRAVADLDWKVQDVVVIPASSLPDEAERPRGSVKR